MSPDRLQLWAESGLWLRMAECLPVGPRHPLPLACPPGVISQNTSQTLLPPLSQHQLGEALHHISFFFPRLCRTQEIQSENKTLSQDGTFPLQHDSHNTSLVTGSLFLLGIKDPVASGKLSNIIKRGDIFSIHAAHVLKVTTGRTFITSLILHEGREGRTILAPLHTVHFRMI